MPSAPTPAAVHAHTVDTTVDAVLMLLVSGECMQRKTDTTLTAMCFRLRMTLLLLQ